MKAVTFVIYYLLTQYGTTHYWLHFLARRRNATIIMDAEKCRRCRRRDRAGPTSDPVATASSPVKVPKNL